MSQNETLGAVQELIAKCDSLIKAGKIGAVSTLLTSVQLSRAPRSLKPALAKICRRAGLLEHGLRLLHPIIRQDAPLDTPATAAEICEYAVLLSRIGSTQEALELLKTVDESKTPEASLYRGFCHISEGDYESAVDGLESFLQSSGDDYSKLIARVNLAASYLFIERLGPVEAMLNETIEIAEAAQAKRLIGNCLELKGSYHFKTGDFVRSRETLARAQMIFGETRSYDQLLVKKWQAAMNAAESGSTAPLHRYRAEALERRHWACVRDADFLIVSMEFEQKLFDHLIFGTPMPAYRERARMKIQATPSETYHFGRPGPQWLDLSSGQLQGRGKLNAGKKIHQVIAALCRDFYGARNMGTLFAELYPGEHFDVNSSPSRVHQLLRRTRRFLEEQGIPVSIENSDGSYRLAFNGPFSIKISLENSRIDASSTEWLALLACFGPGSRFTAESACEKLNVSRSKFLRIARKAVESGMLVKSGTGNQHTYEIRTLKKAA